MTIKFTNEDLARLQNTLTTKIDDQEDRHASTTHGETALQIYDEIIELQALRNKVQAALNEQAGGTHETLKDSLPPVEGL